MPAAGYVRVQQYEEAAHPRSRLFRRGLFLGFAIAVAILGCVAIAITLPITSMMRTTHTTHTHPTPGDAPTPIIVVPTHHMHPQLHCIYSQTELACAEAARRHGKPGLALPWVDLCPHDNHVLYNTTGENTDTSKCMNVSHFPTGCVFWTTNDTTRSGFTFVQNGTAQCGETVTLPHENVSHTLYCVPTCHIEPIVVTTTTAETTTSVASTAPGTTPAPTTSTAPETTPAPTTSTAPAPTTSAPAPTTSTAPETTPTPTTSTAAATTTAPTPTTSAPETTTSTAPAPTTSTAAATTTAPETTPAPTTSTAPTPTTSTAAATTSAPTPTTAPPETPPPEPEVSYSSCRMTEQRYCVKNKTTTIGDASTVQIIDCECDECAYVTGCKCGAHEGYFNPGAPPAACTGPFATSPCKLPNMTLGCDTINGERYLTEQFVCGDGSASSRNGKPTHYSCPFICLTQAQMQFFEPTFDGVCGAEDCCGNWRMQPLVDPDTGLVSQCRAPAVGSGVQKPWYIPWSDVFAIGLPQPEQCRATCGNSSSTMCTDFRTETCGNYITGPGFRYVHLPKDTMPGCTQALPENTECEQNVVYDVYPNGGRCIRGCELMVQGHCMSLVTLQHPDIPKDHTYTQSATFNSTFWDAVKMNETFVVNITYGPLCPPNMVCSNLPVVGSTTCQPLTCCNMCGEKSQEHLSSKKIQPWLCTHVKAPCQFYWDEGPGSTSYPPLSCEDSILNSSVVDREQIMGPCNGACNASMGDACSPDGLCVQQVWTGKRSRCETKKPYPYVYVVSLPAVADNLVMDTTRWMLIDGEPRGFVCTWGYNNNIYIVPYPFSSEPLFLTQFKSFTDVTFVQRSTLMKDGQRLFQPNTYSTNIPGAVNIDITLTRTTNTLEDGAGGSGLQNTCMPPDFICESHSITFGFSNLVNPPEQYAFALNGSVPVNISDCTLCFIGAFFAVGDCVSTPSASIHVNVTAVSSGGCAALGPCDINNCAYQCLHQEDSDKVYKGSLASCDSPWSGALAPVCEGLDGDLSTWYPCFLTPKQINFGFNNRASSCSIGLWGSVTCTDLNAIPSLDGAFCVCKGGYEVVSGACKACPVGQNSNMGKPCMNIYPSGEVQTLKLVNNSLQYIGGANFVGVTVYGGSLNYSAVYDLWAPMKNDLKGPGLFFVQYGSSASICAMSVEHKQICGNQYSGGFSGSETYIGYTTATSGVISGEVQGSFSGCSGAPIFNSDSYAPYCSKPRKVETCYPGSIMNPKIYTTDIPCNNTVDYVGFSSLVNSDNRPGIGCDYVVFITNWTGSYLFDVTTVLNKCHGTGWRVGDRIVSPSDYWWHFDLQVASISNQQPIFIPIKP